MREQVTARLEKLRAEYDSGQKMLQELEARILDVRQTMLRISGAIQVLEELVAEPGASQDTGGHVPGP